MRFSPWLSALLLVCGACNGADDGDTSGANGTGRTTRNIPSVIGQDAASPDAASPVSSERPSDAGPGEPSATDDAATGPVVDSGGVDAGCTGSACPCSGEDEERVGEQCLPRHLYGVIGAADNDGYASASGGGIAGAASGFWVAALVHVPQVPTRSTAIAGRGNFPGGWVLVSQAGQFQLLLGVLSPSPGVSYGSPLSAFTNDDVGKTHLVVGVFDGSTVRLYVDAQLVGSPQPATGFAPIDFPFMISARPDNLYYSNRELFIAGVMGGQSAPSLVEVVDLYARVKAERKLSPIPAKTDRLWRFERATLAPTVVSDQITGGDPLTRVGSERLEQFVPNFAW